MDWFRKKEKEKRKEQLKNKEAILSKIEEIKANWKIEWIIINSKLCMGSGYLVNPKKLLEDDFAKNPGYFFTADYSSKKAKLKDMPRIRDLIQKTFIIQYYTQIPAESNEPCIGLASAGIGGIGWYSEQSENSGFIKNKGPTTTLEFYVTKK